MNGAILEMELFIKLTPGQLFLNSVRSYGTWIYGCKSFVWWTVSRQSAKYSNYQIIQNVDYCGYSLWAEKPITWSVTVETRHLS